MYVVLCASQSAVTPQARNHPLADNTETSGTLAPSYNRRAFLFTRKFAVAATDIIRLCWYTAPAKCRPAQFRGYIRIAKYGVKRRQEDYRAAYHDGFVILSDREVPGSAGKK